MSDIVFTGRTVRLEPLREDHAADLAACGGDAEIWRFMLHPPLAGLADARHWISQSLAERDAGTRVPFAVVALDTGRAVGSSSYLALRPLHRGLEIGHTWLGRAWQRTACNTECKYLLLAHAFEERKMMRVEFKTDERNAASQRALERIGAVREGTFRAHMIMRDGFVRNSVYYSIIRDEWPEVKERLWMLLASHGVHLGEKEAMKATDILMQEHRVIERVLDALEAAARRLDEGRPVRPGFFLDAAAFIKGFADGCHHRKEEGVLFQTMAESGMPTITGPIAVMLAEHEQGRHYTRAMREAAERLEAGDGSARAPVTTSALAYTALLRQHIMKEDRVLFPMADRVIPPERHEKVALDFQRVEQEHAGEGAHEKYLALAERLATEATEE